MGKIAILGLGQSLALYEPDNYDTSIGVNDIWRHHKTPYVVCLDHPNVFLKWQDRLKVINECRPTRFYSQIVRWDTHPAFQQITLYPGYPEKHIDIDLPHFYKSFCSPYVSVQIAYKYLDATEIDIYGVDLVNHPHLDRNLCAKIKIHFGHLFTALRKKDVKIQVYGQGILKSLVQ